MHSSMILPPHKKRYLSRENRIARTGRVGDATEDVGGITVRGEGRLGGRERGDAL